MEQKSNQYLLSICIPTYNRADFLRISLQKLQEAITKDMSIELIVSDNCSPDDTPKVLSEAKENGLQFIYNRNEVNLGSNGNFLQCFKLAHGKYIWLLGDDDFIVPAHFVRLYNLLESGDYGLVFLSTSPKTKEQKPKITDNVGDFLGEVNVWITFMSGNIFRHEVIQMVDGNKYLDTWLVQVPYFLKSSVLGYPNVIYYPQVLECGADSKNNGGYNYFQVFVANYLNLLSEFEDNGYIKHSTYKYMKEDIFKNFHIGFIWRLLIKKEKNNLGVKDGWKILFRYYGYELYFYWYTTYRIAKFGISFLIHKIKK